MTRLSELSRYLREAPPRFAGFSGLNVKYLAAVAERRRLIVAAFDAGRTQTEIATECGCSTSRIGQILREESA